VLNTATKQPLSFPHKCVEQRAPSGYGVFPRLECFEVAWASSPIEAARLLFAVPPILGRPHFVVAGLRLQAMFLTPHPYLRTKSPHQCVRFLQSLFEDRCSDLDGAVKKKPREIRCYDYVNHPYERVRDALRKDALRVFQSATKSAVSRARSVASELHVDVGGIGVKAEVNISVKSVEEKVVDSLPSPVTRLLLEWEGASMPGLFPIMKAELSVYPLTVTETQLDFLGVYEPPLGAVGKAMNAVIGHRIAEVSVHRFVSDVAAYLRQALSE